MDEQEMKELIADAERLCRAIAPEVLAGLPLYIVPYSQIPSDLWLGGCDAFTNLFLDLHLQPQLGDQWKGRGPAIAFDDAELARWGEGVWRRGWFMGVVLHELAHILEKRWSFDWSPPAELLKENRTDAAEQSGPLTEEKNQVAQIYHHDARFIRCALHLHHRASKIEAVPLARILTTHSLLCFHYHAWAAALGDECERLEHLPISKILKRKPPQAFTGLWQNALRFSQGEHPPWHSVTAQTEKESTMTILDKITSVFRKRERTAIEGFDQLVRAVADGKNIDAGEAAAILDAASKSPQDLATAVQLILHRRELRKRFDAGVKAQAELDQIDAHSRQWEQERERLIEAFDEKHFAPLRGRIPPLESAVRQGRQAEQELVSTAVHAADQVQRIDTREPSRRMLDLRDRLTDLDRRLHAVADWTPEKRRMHEGMNEYGQAFAGSPPDEGAVAKLRAERDALQGELARIEGELAENNRQVEAAERQRQETALSVD